MTCPFLLFLTIFLLFVFFFVLTQRFYCCNFPILSTSFVKVGKDAGLGRNNMEVYGEAILRMREHSAEIRLLVSQV